MYENYKLGKTLKPSEVCLVAEQYEAGTFTRKFHKHVPRYRLSNEVRLHLLRALVIHFSALGAETIVHCYLNLSRDIFPAACCVLLI